MSSDDILTIALFGFAIFCLDKAFFNWLSRIEEWRERRRKSFQERLMRIAESLKKQNTASETAQANSGTIVKTVVADVGQHGTETPFSLLGIDHLSPVEQRRELTRLFMKWNDLTVHDDPEIRQKAKRMIELVVACKKKIGDTGSDDNMVKLSMS